MLESLITDHLDPGYAAAAARKAAAPAETKAPARRKLTSTTYLVIGLLLAGLVLGIAARRTVLDAPSAEKTREALLADIAAAQAKQSKLAATADELGGQIAGLQTVLGAGGPLAMVSQRQLQGGLVAVDGPGLRIVVDTGPRGQILDRDLQLLVNGLWASGAEAVAVGGVRLGVTTAIRQAGSAVLVDNRPVFWPITIDAVGNSSQLHVNLVGTTGFGRFTSFVSLYGITFDVATRTDLHLPAATEPDQRYAAPQTTVPTTR